MNRIYTILLLTIISVCLQLGSVESNAQALNRTMVEVKQFEKQEENMVVRMEFNLADLKLKSRGKLQLVPIIRTASDTLTLAPLEVDGKIRHKVYKRKKHFKDDTYKTDSITVVRYDDPVTIPYVASVPFEDWMSTAALYLDQSGCPGCGFVKVDLPEILLADHPSMLPTPTGFAYAPEPQVSFLMPESEPKRRTQKESAYLKFPSGGSVINPVFKDNARELARVNKLVEELIYDEYISVTRITIQGLSSIEGSYPANLKLSERRAKAFEEYLRKKYGLPATLFSTTWVGEDWTGLRQLVEQGDLVNKGRVLDIINSTDVFEGREKQLMLIDEGGTYKFMLTNYFPLLRKVDYSIEYSVKQLSEDESAKLLKEHPSHLSPKELFLLAQHYDKLSDRFKEIMDISIATYPSNVATNLNISATYILRGKYDIADHYLMSAGNSASSFNNGGVILMMKGKTKEAREVLTKAKELGSIEADHNLKELDKLERSTEH